MSVVAVRQSSTSGNHFSILLLCTQWKYSSVLLVVVVVELVRYVYCDLSLIIPPSLPPQSCPNEDNSTTDRLTDLLFLPNKS